MIDFFYYRSWLWNEEADQSFVNDLSAINGISTPSMSLLLLLFTVKRFLIKGSFVDDTIAMQFPFTLFNLLKMSPEFCWLNPTLSTIIFLDPAKFYLWISWCGKEKLQTGSKWDISLSFKSVWWLEYLHVKAESGWRNWVSQHFSILKPGALVFGRSNVLFGFMLVLF